MVKKFSITKKTKTSRKTSYKQASKVKQARTEKLQLAKFLIIASSITIAVLASVLPYVWIEPVESVKKVEQAESDLMPIRVLEIEGKLIQVTREQITTKIINASKPQILETQPADQGMGIIGYFGSDLQILEERLRTLPWIQKVELRRVWPDRLRIVIKEHKAIARWNSGKLVNEYGELFLPGNLNGFEYLPLLTGPDQELERLLLTFQELQQLFTPAELQLAILNLNHRYSWSLELTNGIKLQVGRRNLMERVERFIALYPLLQRESKLPIEKVDLRYDTGLAVTRLETEERQASL